MSSCISCNKELLEGSKFCKYCGASQSQPKIEGATKTVSSCSACGTPLLVGAKFCRSCGTSAISTMQPVIKQADQLVRKKVQETTYATNEYKNANSHPSKGNKFLLVTLLLVCVAAAVYFIGSKKSQSFIDACVEYRVNEFRQNFGDSQLITFDMLEWWKSECKK